MPISDAASSAFRFARARPLDFRQPGREDPARAKRLEACGWQDR